MDVAHPERLLPLLVRHGLVRGDGGRDAADLVDLDEAPVLVVGPDERQEDDQAVDLVELPVLDSPFLAVVLVGLRGHVARVPDVFLCLPSLFPAA